MQEISLLIEHYKDYQRATYQHDGRTYYFFSPTNPKHSLDNSSDVPPLSAPDWDILIQKTVEAYPDKEHFAYSERDGSFTPDDTPDWMQWEWQQ